MKICVVVPIKHLATSKRRLASVLTLENRMRLTLDMLEDVLKAIRASTVKEAVVVGSDPRVRELAAKNGVLYKDEDGRGLNRAITGSIGWCTKRGVEAVLVLPGDIPLLSPEDVNRIIEIAGEREPTVVLSPSKNGGTNALFMRPPNLIPVTYGRGSFKKHLNLIRARGVRPKVYYSPSLAFDIDSQKDLRRLVETPSITISAQFVAKVIQKEAA